MIDKVLETIKKHHLIEEGESILAGVSGGPDSICLLHVLHSLAPRLNIKVFAVHINHQLRGEESEGDEQYVREFCEGLGVPIYVHSVDIREISRCNRVSLEEAGRDARYRQFALLADSLGAGKIAVAHNKNDQAETVLMHMLRGSGLDGLRGMEHKRGKIIRPLLDVERKEIEAYCAENSLKPRTDSSNLENVYTRNRIRLDLIPCIDRLFEIDIVESIYKMSGLLKDEIDFIEGYSEEAYGGCTARREKGEVWLDLPRLKEYHPAIRKRVVRHALREVKGDLKGMESIHVEDILHLGLNGRTGAQIHLPCKIRAGRSYDVLKIFASVENDRSALPDKPLNIPGITRAEGFHFVIEALVEEGQRQNPGDTSTVQFFDYEKLKAGINIRSRKEGDIFKPYRSNGTKKLKEYFIDRKIPRDVRDGIPLVATGNEIVWIIGYKISDKFKVTENTKRVLKLVYKNE